MGHAKDVTTAEIGQQGAMSGGTGIRRPISASVEVTNRTRLDRLTVVSFLFTAAAVTTAWMIGLAWGAIALAQWLFRWLFS